MARTVHYHPEFQSDVLAAAQWYDQRQEGLGADFIARVRKAALQLTADPGRRSRLEYGLRYWPVERFPYVVFYDFTDENIWIFGAMHTSQQPDKWQGRLE